MLHQPGLIFLSNRCSMLGNLVSNIQISLQTSIRSCLQLLGHIAAFTFKDGVWHIPLQCFQGYLKIVYTPNKHNLNKLLSVPRQVLVSTQVMGGPGQCLHGDSICSVSSLCHHNNGCIYDELGQYSWGPSPFRVNALPNRDKLHINRLKQRELRNACIYVLPLIRKKNIKILMDNIACMFFINWEGWARYPSLCTEAIKLWNWWIVNCILISATCLNYKQVSRQQQALFPVLWMEVGSSDSQ